MVTFDPAIREPIEPASPMPPKTIPKQPANSPDVDTTAADDAEPASAAAPLAAHLKPFGDATPSMAQYLEIKAANPDSILWYRMGDFYELFFEDAVVAANALSIVLTKRGKHLGDDIPMCGVPVVRADDYLQRLIKKGYRVAVCEQLEDPAEARKRGAKAVVRRDVVRLVTPGTLTEDTLLDAKARNYLTAVFIAPAGGKPGKAAAKAGDAELAIASLDISTGECEVGTLTRDDLPGELVRLSPSEVIATDQGLLDPDLKRWIGIIGAASTPVAAASFDSLAGERALKAQLGVTDLTAFGGFSRIELSALAALLKYVELTQLGRRAAMRPPRKTGPDAVLTIDAASRASLELIKTTSGDRQGSLLAAIDRTVTASGARELAARLSSPLRDVPTINARLDAVGYLVERDLLKEDVRAGLRAAPDIARALSRLSLQRGTPRDLGAIRDGLAAADVCAGRLQHAGAAIGLPEPLALIATRLTGVARTLGPELKIALIDEPPHLRRDGGFIREDYSAELDQMRTLAADSRQVILKLEARYIDETGVKSLKIKHNNMLGYFIEATQTNAKPLTVSPHDATFKHRQTMSNAMRFSTTELIEIEGRIASSGERALALEQEIFTQLQTAVLDQTQELQALAAALAELDHHAGLAALAYDEGYVRPTIDGSTVFEIRGGRHPVVEQALKRGASGLFIDNDCVLGVAPQAGFGADAGPSSGPCSGPSSGMGIPGFDETTRGRIWLVTGPNMAGKSTFLRQNALIALLAQMGAYVPAKSAHIGCVDRLFSRVGAADDLARGRSTFMVEMVETAGILNQATDRSLVILDEIGRGTATFDGLSIAWATVEYLHDVNKCRALFATHYHELTQLSGRLADVGNVTIDVKEWQDEIVFLHKLKPGAADRSYGIQVGKLAGLPKRVVSRATEVLARLEKNNRRAGAGGSTLEDLPLFAIRQPDQGRADAARAAPAPSAVDLAIAALRPDELTPKQALDELYRLKDLARPQT
jgi:DNA mismatch repair protein MutS